MSLSFCVTNLLLLRKIPRSLLLTVLTMERLHDEEQQAGRSGLRWEASSIPEPGEDGGLRSPGPVTTPVLLFCCRRTKDHNDHHASC